jgi:S1-C subfamily serine protease
MKRYLFACLLSGGFGALLAIAMMSDSGQSDAIAQERTPVLIDDTGNNPRFRAPTGAAGVASDQFTPDEQVNISVYEKANRSVVHITTRTTRPGGFFMMEVPAEGEGSGSLLDMEGHILTNYHVIQGAREIRVTLFNGETYEAGLIGRDPPNDIAVLKISAPRQFLYPIKLGESSRLKVGQKILAIGNPFGLDRTLTVGIVSSLNRSIPSRTGRDMKSIIQIDAALNRGNSGGPLLNTRGELIGMNTAIANPSQTGENTGVGFAIPVNTINRVVPQLLEHGRVIRPVHGIASVYEADRGLIIIDVVPGSPAARAGLQGFKVVTQRERRGGFVYERTFVDRDNADLIVAVDGKRVTTGDEFQDLVESKQPGDRIIIRVTRNNREIEVPVTLGASD